VSLPIFPPEVRCDGCRHWSREPLSTDGHCRRLVAADSPLWVEGDVSNAVYTAPGFACRLWEDLARPTASG
jgi:hypothetical protein